MSIITMIVGQLHVAASNREVCRYIRSKLNYGPRTSKRKKWRNTRKKYYREAINAHKKNQDLVSAFRL